MKVTILITAIALVVAVSCGSNETGAVGGPDAIGPTGGDGGSEIDGARGAGIRLVTANEGAQIRADPPDGLIVLDVRTPDEFDEGHLEGATMIDFYAPDFADQLADLDPDRPYLLYCRSGNRSGQTTVIMEQLGFTDVADIDGGIVAWGEAGLPMSG